MRTIRKHTPGNRNLETAQRNNGIPSNAEEATRAWGNFSDDNNLLCHKLLMEQYGLCCYTELNLAELKRDTGLNAHFEHEQPKSSYPRKTFDECNILRCVLSSSDLQSYSSTQRFGGHYKDCNSHLSYDPSMFISPQSQNCRNYFIYMEDGIVVPDLKIDPISKDRAIYTIKILNLNAPFLVAERKRWITEIIREIDKLIDTRNTIGLTNLAECELTLTNRTHQDLLQGDFPQLRSFHSAIRARFGSIGEDVIQQHCPHID